MTAKHNLLIMSMALLTYFIHTRHNDGMDKNTETAAAAVAAEAAILSRIASGGERRAILAIARALRDPLAVARLLQDSDQNASQDIATCQPTRKTA